MGVYPSPELVSLQRAAETTGKPPPQQQPEAPWMWGVGRSSCRKRSKRGPAEVSKPREDPGGLLPQASLGSPLKNSCPASWWGPCQLSRCGKSRGSASRPHPPSPPTDLTRGLMKGKRAWTLTGRSPPCRLNYFCLKSSTHFPQTALTSPRLPPTHKLFGSH